MRWVFAIRAMRSGSITESYLDSLAVRIESIRIGARPWRRFLVFTELTRSRKGVEYIALFVYFAFECEAPFFAHLPIRTLTQLHSMDENGVRRWTPPSRQRHYPLFGHADGYVFICRSKVLL